MDFIWDNTKRLSNLKKHNIDFIDVISVLEDEQAMTIEDTYHNEQRFVTIGVDAFQRILVVVYSYDEKNLIRIISARKANKKERQRYQR